MADKCVKCNVQFDNIKNVASCSDCKGLFHPACCDIKTEEALGKLRSKKTSVKWRCDGCKLETASSQSRSDSEPVDQISVAAILQAIRKDMSDNMSESRDRFSKIETSILSVRNVVDDFKNKLIFLEEESKTTKELCSVNATKLEKQDVIIQELRRELLDTQQYSRRSNLEIKGVPQTDNENIYAIMAEMAKTLMIPFDRSDISIAHRLPKPKSGHPTIIVAFVSRSTKENWLAAAKRRKLKTTDISTHFEPGPVYVNSHLTSHNKQLLGTAKGYVRAGKLVAAWTVDDKVLVRKEVGQRAERLRVVEDLERLVG